MADPITLDFSKAQPIQPAQPQGTNDQGSAGVTLDFSKAQPIDTGTTPQQTNSGQSPIATISAAPEPTTLLGKFGKWADNVSNDLKYGTDETGIGTVLKKMGAHGVYAGNPQAVGDFMTSLPLGLLKVAKGATEAAPQIIGGPKGKTWEGVKDIANGAIQASEMPAAFMAPEEAELAANKAGQATEAVKAVPKSALDAFRESAAQPALRAGVKQAVSTAAKDSGVAEPLSQSFYKMVEEGANNILAQSKNDYKVLDQATGGRVQRFQDRLENIREAMRELTGTEEDVTKEASLLKAQKETEDAMQDAFNDARKQGVDPDLIDRASANFKKSHALLDVDNAVQKSLSGKPVELGGKKGLPETIDPKKFAPRINQLWKSGRLEQALGKDAADRLANYANDAATLQRRAITLKKIGLWVAGSIGAGTALGTGLHLLSTENP